jgi:hypothetical protein
VSAISFTTLKNAIHAWIVAGSGLAATQAVWARQRDTQGNPVPRPSGMYVSMSFLGFVTPGFDDPSAYTVDANVLTQHVQGPRILMLSLQVYQGLPTGGNDTDAIGILNDIFAYANSDAGAQALQLARVGIGSYDDPQYVPEKSNEAKSELRAYSTVRLHTGSKATYSSAAGTGWISHVTAAGEFTTETGTDTVTVSVDE